MILTSGAPRARRGSLASAADARRRRRHSPSTGSRPDPCGSRSTCTAACPPSRSSAFPTPRCARRASGCGRRSPTAASSSRCGGSSPTWRPASLRKAGPGLDLAIAGGAAGRLGAARVGARWPRAGDGRRAGPGRLGAAGRRACWRSPRRRASRAPTAIVVPAENGPEAALVAGIEVIPLDSLAQLPRPRGGRVGAGAPGAAAAARRRPTTAGPDLADLRGQRHLRHALEVAAAGGHSLLMVGPPGAGKSLAASRLPSILPPPAPEEALEVARIASACGRLGDRPSAAAGRSAPRITRSARPGLVGGGNPPRPGEATLAHRGVLFLDELCEFRRDALEALRAPLESGWVSIARAGGLGSGCPAASCSSPPPTPVPAGAARPTRSAAARRSRPALPGAAQRRARRPHRHPRRDPPAERRGDRRAGRASPRPRCASGSTRPATRQGSRLGPGRCNAEMTPAEARECALERGRRGAARRVLLAAQAQRPRPRPGPAAGADDRRPRRQRGDRARADGPGPAAAAEGLTSELAATPARPACAARGCSPTSRPTSRRSRPALPGSRSPELLRLSNEDLAAAVAPQVADADPGGGRGDAARQPARRAWRRRMLGLLPPRPALPGGPARRGRRALGADRPRRPGPAAASSPTAPASVTVVGARRASSYGREVARELGRDLAAAGLVVVSGLAFGIDACAHRGALEAGLHRRRPRLRRRRRLPGGPPLALAADPGERPRPLRAAAGDAAPGAGPSRPATGSWPRWPG